MKYSKAVKMLYILKIQSFIAQLRKTLFQIFALNVNYPSTLTHSSVKNVLPIHYPVNIQERQIKSLSRLAIPITISIQKPRNV
jgi:hypothetical protein